MNDQPTLVIMAAGMGSRFGGLKQITPVDPEGHFIIDFSLYDAYRAGFRRVAFIIKRELEAEFREKIGTRMERFFHVDYVYQELTRLPEGFSVPDGRVKPWGTAHAVACCRGVVKGPMAVINADDYYGPSAFSTIYKFLTENTRGDRYAMVGYKLRNTVTEHGSVAACARRKTAFSRAWSSAQRSLSAATTRSIPKTARRLCRCPAARWCR